MGLSDREACIYANIGSQTLYDYQKKNPEFSEQKEEYKTNPILLAKKTIFNALEKGDIRISQWYLERKARNEFSIRKELKMRPTDDELNKLCDDLERESNFSEIVGFKELQQVMNGVPTMP